MSNLDANSVADDDDDQVEQFEDAEDSLPITFLIKFVKTFDLLYNP